MKVSSESLQLREDLKKGVFVDGISEETAHSASRMLELLKEGARNRHVGATKMNMESSRSHSVFTLSIGSRTKEGGMIKTRESKFHFVDLAGSERQKSTEAIGERLKEASNINKSLTVLGSVINSLVEASNGKKVFIRYRDSKLTFFLKDSLGGNAKTAMIANISPASINFQETLSTLQFAQRAKMIRNVASANEEASGNSEALQKEIKKLKEELQISKNAVSNLQNEVSAFQKRGKHEEKTLKKLEEAVSKDLKNEGMAEKLSELLENCLLQLQVEVLKRDEEYQLSKRAMEIFEENEREYKCLLKLKRERLSDSDSEVVEKLDRILGNFQLTGKVFLENLVLRKFYDSSKNKWNPTSMYSLGKVIMEARGDLLELLGALENSKRQREAIQEALLEIKDGLGLEEKAKIEKNERGSAIQNSRMEELLLEISSLKADLQKEMFERETLATKNTGLKFELDQVRSSYSRLLERSSRNQSLMGVDGSQNGQFSQPKGESEMIIEEFVGLKEENDDLRLEIHTIEEKTKEALNRMKEQLESLGQSNQNLFEKKCEVESILAKKDREILENIETIKRIQSEKNLLQIELIQCRMDLEEAQAAQNEPFLEKETFEIKENDLYEKIEAKQREKDELQCEITKLREEIENLNMTIEFNKAEFKKMLENSKASEEAKETRRISEIDNFQDLLKSERELSQKQTTAIEKLKEKTQSYERELKSTRGELEKCQNDFKELSEAYEQSRKQSEKMILEEEEKHKEEINALKKKTQKDQKNERKKANSERKEMEKELKEKTREVGKLEEMVQEEKEKCGVYKSSYELVMNQIRNTGETKKDLMGQVRNTREKIESMERYHESLALKKGRIDELEAILVKRDKRISDLEESFQKMSQKNSDLLVGMRTLEIQIQKQEGEINMHLEEIHFLKYQLINVEETYKSSCGLSPNRSKTSKRSHSFGNSEETNKSKRKINEEVNLKRLFKDKDDQIKSLQNEVRMKKFRENLLEKEFHLLQMKLRGLGSSSYLNKNEGPLMDFEAIQKLVRGPEEKEEKVILEPFKKRVRNMSKTTNKKVNVK